MANTAMLHFTYPQVFEALGKFIANKDLRDVFVMEFEQGIIVSGSTMHQQRLVTSVETETFVFSEDDLRALISGKSK